jgi:branched-subunit amino acid transport protein
LVIAVELFTVNNKFSIQDNSLELLAAIPTILVAIKKNDLLLTVIVGIILIAILRISLFYL